MTTTIFKFNCTYLCANLDDFKKLFSEPKIAKNLLVQFCRARRDESIALKKFEKFENFLL